MWIAEDECFECGYKGPELHNHHVVPRIREGTQTLPLCGACHAKAHHREKNMTTSALLKESFRQRREQNPNIKFGNPNIMRDAHAKGLHTRVSNAKEFNAQIQEVVGALQSKGYTQTQCVALLNDELKITTRRGCRWSRPSLRRVLKYDASEHYIKKETK